jgi:hypothetical protein
MLAKKRTVIYEIVEENTFFILTPDMEFKRCPGAASCAVAYPYLDKVDTCHVFDAKATKGGGREPASTEAFLIAFRSENSASLAQTCRRSNVHRYCIPSYTVEELLTVRGYFNVSEQAVRERVVQLGPSIRYILVNNYDETLTATLAKARFIAPEQLETFLQGRAPAGTSDDVFAGLLSVHVNEDDFPADPWKAYTLDHVTWSFASRNICKIIYGNANKKARSFVRNFICEVNTTTGLTRLKGVVGNFLELMVDEFLTERTFQSSRRLTDNAAENFALQPHSFWPDDWNIPGSNLLLRAGQGGLQIESALERNRDPHSLFCFCKNLAGVDYLACDGLLAIQVTTSTTHPVSFDALSTICAHAREHHPGESVKLIFVVPDQIISREPIGAWRLTQSYRVTDLVELGGKMRKVGRSCKFESLDTEQQLKLNNLEQWVVGFPTPEEEE